jgi:penicillin-binding protein, 1A family
LSRFISWLLSLTFAALLFGVIAAAGVFYYYGAGLPDYKALASYEPPVMTRLYSNDGRAFAEYAHEKRIYVPHEAIPDHVKKAFLSAEDKNFYSHFGIDIPSIIAAAITNLSRIGTSKRPIGASTITQQVAKNLLMADVSHMVSLERKIKEAIISFRIERAYSKDYIFELYLNEVYLGNRSYGIAAAALNYFNKSLEELTIAEAAYLATLPKAPSRYNPYKHRALTYARRNWVIGRMQEDGFITAEEAEKAKQEPIEFVRRDQIDTVQGTYFAEEVRRELLRTFGNNALYGNGYVVRTTLDPRLQQLAEQTLQEGLVRYDRQHGWRGPIVRLGVNGADYSQRGKESSWAQKLQNIAQPAGAGPWQLAVILEVTRTHTLIGFRDGSQGLIPLSEFKWARRWISDTERGPEVTHPQQVVKPGDVVLTALVMEKSSVGLQASDQARQADGHDLEQTAEGKRPQQEAPKTIGGYPVYKLCQIPAVSGALVVLEPHTGRVLAMQGGYSFEVSQFNRATQAMRQTGSAFKTFVYLAALESGLTPSTILEDAPFAINLGYGLGIWRPNNWDKEFKGPITLRRSFELSRNVAAIRMVHELVGMKRVTEVAKRFNIDRNMPVQLSGVLGASETTVLRLAAAYAMLANGGKLVVPSFFDHVQDRRGKTVLVNSYNICQNCELESPEILPELRDLRPQVTDSIAAYQMTSLLRGVVERGTGRKVHELAHEVVVKSGTTNDYRDAWMVGYSPTLVVAVYVGFDSPRTLGHKHYGAVVAGPIFTAFMEQALAGKPPVPFQVPKGAQLVRVNPFTGNRATSADKTVIYEAFKPGTEVTRTGRMPTTDTEGMTAADEEEYPQSPFAPQNEALPSASGTSDAEQVTGTGGLY